ncbi:MAG TPA: DNA-3-methyladenine glycosylase 2 family protein [Patescibacteria group bacterium]|nr:DNA-3-methyladenine glycosylase 2 family protein [Patescibacteria group bacterium]
MTPDAGMEIKLDRPLDLLDTLGQLETGPWLQLRRDEAWRASMTPEGPSELHLKVAIETVMVEAWGPGARWAVDQARLLCGEADDASGFVPVHPLIRQMHRGHPGLRVPRTHAVFEALVPTVIGQLVTGVESALAYRALVTALGEPAPGPRAMTVPPPAHVLAAIPYWRFHGFGIERRRAEVIIRAARSAKRLEEIAGMTRDAAYGRLLAFPGVGPWTAAKVAAVAIGDADAVPVGDYHLPHTVGYALEGTPRSSDERMLELLEPYAGQRGRVLRLIGLAGITAPRFGPRKPLRNIRHS